MVMEVVGNGFCWGSVTPGCIQLFFSEGSQTRLGSPMYCRKCKLRCLRNLVSTISLTSWLIWHVIFKLPIQGGLTGVIADTGTLGLPDGMANVYTGRVQWHRQHIPGGVSQRGQRVAPAT